MGRADGRRTRGKSLRNGGDGAGMVHCEHRKTMANMLGRRGREQVSAKNSMNKSVKIITRFILVRGASLGAIGMHAHRKTIHCKA